MKRFIQSLLLVAFFIGTTIPAWGQTSTQGKEFWVALIPSKSPNGEDPAGKTSGDNKYTFEPYIAISAQKKCTIKVSNPSTKNGWSQTYSITSDNSWLEIKDIPKDKWYTQNTMPGTGTYDLGLKVEADEDVSVFCALRWTYSFDATNVLPVTALQSDYIVQTYQPSSKSYKKNAFTIVAAEDCTVDITPTDGTSFTSVNLKAGQVYHRISNEMKSLSGTRIVAQGGKKIAVFSGAPLANVPTNKSDRDLLYEQLFPLDYWGQNFVVVRTKEKDANRVIITAQENNTEVIIYGRYDPSTEKNTAPHELLVNDTLTLNSGQSYEFEMSAGYAEDARGGAPKSRWDEDRTSDLNALNAVTFVDSAVYIKASCPCAVLSYDVGNSYLRKIDDVENGKLLTEAHYTLKSDGKYDKIWGAPSMTWIAPIEQMIDDIVFGVMGTDKTDRHFINIVVPTQDIENTYIGAALVDNMAKFKPVEGNSDYSYARLSLPPTTTSGMYYHLYNKLGFVATVYGNGDDESYAYSAGSSAVKRAIAVDGYRFTNQMDVSDVKQLYCINTDLLFNPQIGTDIIDKVVWDFGDGTSATTEKEDDITISHLYTTPGWYDVKALVSAHRDCPYSSYPEEEVMFTFRVVEADTIPVGSGHDCIEADSTYKGVKLTADSIQYLLTHSANTTNEDERKNCYDPVEITFMSYGIKTTHRDTINAKDSALVSGVWYYPETVPADSIVRDTIYDGNQYDCDSIIYHFLNITTCLDVEIVNDADAQHVCGEKKMDVAYKITRGEAGNAAVSFDGQLRVAITLDKTTRGESVVVLPTENLVPGKHHADIFIEDVNCKDTITKAYDFTVYYPNTIFARKFNNVLAVYKKGYGGNKLYDFTAYQWYFNDEAIPNATKSIYHVEGKLASGSYYVVLTRADLEALPSCPITINEDELPDYDQSNAPAQKMIRNSRMVIIKDGRTYDVYGQRVE